MSRKCLADSEGAVLAQWGLLSSYNICLDIVWIDPLPLKQNIKTEQTQSAKWILNIVGEVSAGCCGMQYRRTGHGPPMTEPLIM